MLTKKIVLIISLLVILLFVPVVAAVGTCTATPPSTAYHDSINNNHILNSWHTFYIPNNELVYGNTWCVKVQNSQIGSDPITDILVNDVYSTSNPLYEKAPLKPGQSDMGSFLIRTNGIGDPYADLHWWVAGNYNAWINIPVDIWVWPMPENTYTFKTTDDEMMFYDFYAQSGYSNRFSPWTVIWTDGVFKLVDVPETHDITTTSRYVFTGWSGKSISTSHKIDFLTSSTTGGTYIANYKKQYYLTVSANPTDLNIQYLSAYYQANPVPLTAPTFSGYTFVKWQVDGVDRSTNPSIYVTMDAPHSAVAVYSTPPPIPFTFQTTDNAMKITGDSYDHNSPWPVSWADGQSITVSVPASQMITGSSKYVFTGWSGKSTSTSSSITISTSASTQGTYTANYKKQHYLFVASNPFIGTLSGDGWYDQGTTVHLTAPTPTDYTFVKWQVDGVDRSTGLSTIDVTMDTTHSAVAFYSTTPIPNTFTFQTTDNAMKITGDGSEHNSPWTVSWTDGLSKTVSVPASQAITGSSKYVFTGWSGKSTSTSSSITVTTSSSTQGTYMANYKKQHYLFVASNPNIGTVPGSEYYDQEYTVRLTAPVTLAGYTFVKWQVDGVDRSTGLSTIDVTMDTTHSAVAFYSTPIPNTFTFQTTDNAMKITGDGSEHNSPWTVSWTDGLSKTVSVPASQAITSASKYVFTGWSGKSTSTSASITVSTSASTQGTYTANYKKQHYLFVTSNPNIGTVPGSEYYDQEYTVRLTAPVTLAGYTFVKWQVDGVDRSTSSTIDVTMDTTHSAVATYSSPLTAPTFSGISPTSGPIAGGTAVTITGGNFVSGGLFGVKIGGNAATSVTRIDASRITATTPAGTAGAKDVVVTNNDGQTVTGTNAYTYGTPSIVITGVYRPGAGFYLKMDNSNNPWNSNDLHLTWDTATLDLPIAGDWNNDGTSETGMYRPGAGFYLKKVAGAWNPTQDQYLTWDTAATDLPIAGDWNNDGTPETGVYRPGAGFYLKKVAGAWNPTQDQYLTWDTAASDRPIAGNFV